MIFSGHAVMGLKPEVHLKMFNVNIKIHIQPDLLVKI